MPAFGAGERTRDRRAGRRALRPGDAVRVRIRRGDPAGAVGQVPLLHLSRPATDRAAGAEGGPPHDADRQRHRHVVQLRPVRRRPPWSRCARRRSPDFEVIVIDDGSTDDSLAVIGRFLDDDRVPTGATEARRAGASQEPRPRSSPRTVHRLSRCRRLLAAAQARTAIARDSSDPAVGVVFSRARLDRRRAASRLHGPTTPVAARVRAQRDCSARTSSASRPR